MERPRDERERLTADRRARVDGVIASVLRDVAKGGLSTALSGQGLEDDLVLVGPQARQADHLLPDFVRGGQSTTWKPRRVK